VRARSGSRAHVADERDDAAHVGPRHVRERAAFDELERDELGGRVVDSRDVRVVEARGGQRLAREAAAQVPVGGGRAQHLERHEPAELHVLGLVDHAHPAAADLADHAVAPADERLRILVPRGHVDEPLHRARRERLAHDCSGPRNQRSSWSSSSRPDTVSVRSCRTTDRKRRRACTRWRETS